MRDEGLKLFPYQDTVGKWTIGYGRNLSDTGLRHSEAVKMLDNDIDTAMHDLFSTYPWAEDLSAPRQAVLINMVFNLGLTKFSGFANTLKAVERGQYANAANGMRASLWARQVKGRAERLAKQMETGTWT